MPTIRPESSSARARLSPDDDLDAALRAMGIKPNKRRRAALLSWSIFGSDDYVTVNSGFQERGHG